MLFDLSMSIYRHRSINNYSVAEKHGLPIIADEIYQGMVFEGDSRSFGELSDNVPVLSCGGLAKR